MRYLEILLLAERVLEARKAGKEWMLEAQVGLGVRTPIETMRTEEGMREVEDLLVRIEHGVLT